MAPCRFNGGANLTDVTRQGDHFHWSKINAKEELLINKALLVLELIEVGSVEEAKQEIDRVESQFPADRSAMIISVLLRHHLLGTGGEAQEKRQTQQGDPERARMEFAEFEILLNEKRIAEARQVIESAYSHDPENPEIAEALATFLKKEGLEYYSKGELMGAVSCWKRALEILPGDAEALGFLRRAKAVKEKQDQ